MFRVTPDKDASSGQDGCPGASIYQLLLGKFRLFSIPGGLDDRLLSDTGGHLWRLVPEA